ncbi:MAG: hypothetical protein ACRC30_01655 [Clostridium sp.]
MIGNFGVVGVLCSILGIYIGIKEDYKRLTVFLFATSILTTTAVITLGEKSITVPNIMALIYFARVVYDVIKGKLERVALNKWLIMFVGYSVISLAFPLIFSNGVQLVGKEGLSKFDIGSVSQIIYLIMSVCVFYSSYILIKNKKINIKTFDKGIKITTLILFILAIIQLVFTNIFNTLMVNRSGHAFIQTLEDGKFRLTTTFDEPSMLATFLAIAIAYFSIKSFENSKNIIYVMGLLIIGLLSRGSTFILAVILNGLIILGYMIKEKKFKEIKVMLIICFGLAVFLEIVFKGILSNEIGQLLYKISGNGTSGSQRVGQFEACLNIFLRYPLTGIGYGLNRSSDWITTLMANGGIISLFLIGRFFYDVIYIKNIDNINTIAYKASVIICLSILLISVPEPYYNFFWLIIAIALTSHKEQHEINFKGKIHEFNEVENV